MTHFRRAFQAVPTKKLLVFAVAGLIAATGLASSAVFYTYDQAGRLTAARYDNGLCVAYVYDTNGNRIAQTNTTAGTAGIWGSGVWGCMEWTP